MNCVDTMKSGLQQILILQMSLSVRSTAFQAQTSLTVFYTGIIDLSILFRHTFFHF